ncbi:peptide chain release factor N(5)-glutamine methyltransferase [Marinimicrobium sp. ABcell2]|uniref:peptide chain release factor N(5)-glutamine methyltransferase n=1 Tax=Marinimicrobium sp. ABcell2 TaxID=3069751 RepID=UPI0027B5665C|nr:peptide chain release factor N(5)-glutamine methyltransferase [Marinimicrobium sp. ABcell2]MDQ2077643.1 peptide chain release factor N(5)-glutamine methyltransferase [Marinimicrobium sp. ABcell2]
MPNSQDSTVSVGQCLAWSAQLEHVSDSARLDVELLLCQVLDRSRTWLYTWPEKDLTETQLTLFKKYLERRAQGEPLAYILGQREFWSLPLEVNSSTLIPRPDTELLVEVTLECLGNSTQTQRVLDLGTGTGAVALALASERPAWLVQGLDVSPEAVALAERNRERLGFSNASFTVSDWFSAVSKQTLYQAIVANPPYIAPDDPHLDLGDVRFEPRSALVAADQGLADIQQIAKTARQFLAPGAWLLLEHGWEQGEAVRQVLTELGYDKVETRKDYGDQERITYGCFGGDAL